MHNTTIDTLEWRLNQRIAELNHAKERVEAILNNSFDSVLLAHTDLRIQQTNPAFNHLFACNIDDYFNVSLLELVDSSSTEAVKNLVLSVITSRSGKIIEARMRRRDGSTFPAELSFGYIKGLDHELDGLVCTLRDITERKKQERQLRYHASLQENVNDAVIATDMNFRIQSWNPAAETIYGWRSAEAVGNDLTLLLKTRYETEEQAEQVLQQFLEDGWWHGEVVQSHKDGSDIYILCSVTLMRDEDGTPLGAVAVNRDITERKKVEQTLRLTLEREKELNEMKSRFVSMASHEFRTPLAIILSSVEMLTHYRRRLPDEQLDRRLNIIAEQVRYLTELVGDVLDLERMRSGRSDFQLAEVDLVALCQEIIEDFQTQSDITHQLNFSHAEASVTLKLDKRLIRQVITNLISNAIKYSPQAQQVWLTLEKTAEEWRLSVRDEGIGIPPADLQWLFEPFHRAANADKIPGTGLGLSITRQAVEMHGGTMTVESELNVGTTFCVHLPLPAVS